MNASAITHAAIRPLTVVNSTRVSDQSHMIKAKTALIVNNNPIAITKKDNTNIKPDSEYLNADCSSVILSTSLRHISQVPPHGMQTQKDISGLRNE